jgi:hypothetical protein
MNAFFGEIQEPTYNYRYLYEIVFRPVMKVILKFISAIKTDKILTVVGSNEIEIRGQRQGSFIVFYPDQTKGYSYPHLETKGLNILMGYKTWKIIPHYILYDDGIV